MSKEKTPDDKLREAAEAIIYDERMTPTQGRAMIKLCKSEASREYHQSLQPKVDVQRYDFIGDISDQCNRCGNMPYNHEEKDSGEWVKWDDVAPHLQTPAPESVIVDPVDFAEWTSVNGWKFVKGVGNNGMWRNENGIVIMEWPTPPLYISGERLKTEYKQSKTNSDGKDDSTN